MFNWTFNELLLSVAKDMKNNEEAGGGIEIDQVGIEYEVVFRLK
jgi:hypothetical protein